jgi:hypothetical protein
VDEGTVQKHCGWFERVQGGADVLLDGVFVGCF